MKIRKKLTVRFIECLVRSQFCDRTNEKLDISILEEMDSCLKQLSHLNCSGISTLRELSIPEWQTNNSLHDIFSALWAILTVNIEGAYLTKERYVLLQSRFYRALVGPMDEHSKRLIEVDWNLDFKCCVPTSNHAFFAGFSEQIKCWANVIDRSCQPSFMWALLFAIVDTNQSPMELRPLEDIQCIFVRSDRSCLTGTTLKVWTMCSI